MTDALGNPTGVFLTGGEVHELAGANQMLLTMQAAILIAEKTDDANK